MALVIGLPSQARNPDRGPAAKSSMVRNVNSAASAAGAGRDAPVPKSSLVEAPYAPAPLSPVPYAAGDVRDRVDAASTPRGGQLTLEDRRRLRREIDEAGRDVYRPRR